MKCKALRSITWTDGSQRHRANEGDEVEIPDEQAPGMIHRGQVEAVTLQVSGEMADVEMFDRALSADEVRDHYDERERAERVSGEYDESEAEG